MNQNISCVHSVNEVMLPKNIEVNRFVSDQKIFAGSSGGHYSNINAAFKM